MSLGQCSGVVLEPHARANISDWWFTGAASTFMKLGVSTVDDETIEKLGELVNDKDVASHIKDIIMGNMFVVIITAIILLFAVGLLLATMIVCMCRWCSPPSEGIQPSKPGMICVLFSYGICVLLVLVGITMFFLSLNSLVEGVRDIPKQLNVTGKDITRAVVNFGNSTGCYFDKNANHTIVQVEAQLMRVNDVTNDIERVLIKPEVFDELLVCVTEYGKTINELTSFASSTNAQLASAPEFERLKETDENLQKLSRNMSSVTETIGVLKTYLHEARNESEKTKEKMREDLEKMGVTIKTGAKQITVKVTEIIEKVSTAVKNAPIEQSAIYLGMLILLPLPLVVVLIFAIVILALRFLCSCGTSEMDPLHPKRGWISVVAGNILACGGYASMIIGAMVFLLAAVFFVIGFILMFGCVNSFEDEEMRIFSILPQLEFSHQIQEGQHINISLHDTFVKCRNEYSFVESIDATQLMAYALLEKEVKLLRTDNFAKKIRRFAIDPQIRTIVEDAEHKIEGLYTNLTGIIDPLPLGPQAKPLLDNLKAATTKLKSSIANVTDLLNKVESRAQRDKWAAEIEESQEGLEYALVDSVAIFLEQMIDQSPQCGSIMKIWEDIGYAICQRLMVPVQGMWLGLIVCAFSSFIVINTLFKGTLYLKNFAKSSKEKAASNERLEGAGSIKQAYEKPDAVAAQTPPVMKPAPTPVVATATDPVDDLNPGLDLPKSKKANGAAHADPGLPKSRKSKKSKISQKTAPETAGEMNGNASGAANMDDGAQN